MRSLKFFRLFGFKVTFNHTWFIAFGFITWSLAGGYFPSQYPGFGPSDYWMTGLFTTVLLFFSVLLHEVAHSYVAKRGGMGVEKIELFLFGGVSKFEREPDSPGSELRMALAGPLISLPLFLFLFFLTRLHFFPYPGLLPGLIECLSIVNLMLFLFNMVPGFPLDGDRVLRALLWRIGGDLKKATRIASLSGKLFGTGFILFGVYLLVRGAVFSGMWLAFIGLFLRSCARESYEETLKRVVLQGVKVKDVMSGDVISVPGALSIEALIDDYFLSRNHIAYPVSDGGKAVGFVTLKAVASAARDRRSGKKVSDIMVPLDETNAVGPDEEAFSMLRRMVETGVGRFVVLSGSKILGMVTRRDIMNRLEITRNLLS